MRRKLLTILLFCLILFVTIIFNDNNSFTIVTENKIKLVPVDDQLCPGVSTCCESGYNVMCHMDDPIKNYRVTDVVCGNRGGRIYHKGMDLTKGSGNGTIYSVFDGIVIATTNNNKNCTPGVGLVCSPVTCSSSRGVSVTIEVTDPKFNGYQLHYMHMSSLSVKVGDSVIKGQAIGKIGNTGCSTGEHLHFQINNYNGDPIYITPYFTDKTSYACGNGGFGYNEKVKEDILGLLKDANGKKYNAILGNCVGSLSGNFFQGIQLLSNGTESNVYSISQGVVVNETTELCKNGISIMNSEGHTYIYCNLKNQKSYNLGDIVEKGSYLGQIGTNNVVNDELLFIAKKNNKYIDFSTEFLLTYGGTCANEDRYNCNSIKSSAEKYLCKNILKNN